MGVAFDTLCYRSIWKPISKRERMSDFMARCEMLTRERLVPLM